MVEWSQVSKPRSIDVQMAAYSRDPPQEGEKRGREGERGGGERVRETERRDILETAWAPCNSLHHSYGVLYRTTSDKCPPLNNENTALCQGQFK